VFLLQIMFGILGVLLRLPRALLLAILLFILGLVLLELAHPSPRHAPQRSSVTRPRGTPRPAARELRDERVGVRRLGVSGAAAPR
jgi:hypothetical protein